MRSFVYVIGDVERKIYKIGKANNPKERLMILKAGNPYLKLIRLFMFKNERYSNYAERRLHIEFAEFRFYGEWFELNSQDLLKVAEKAKSLQGYGKFTYIGDCERLLIWNIPTEQVLKWTNGR